MAKVHVMTKGSKRFGVVCLPIATTYEIDQNGKKVTIWKGGVECRTFVLGDEAEYHSYNLSYTGTITKISDKAVTIVAYKGSTCEKVHRLDWSSFCWRNYKFDAAKTAAENSETMNYI